MLVKPKRDQDETNPLATNGNHEYWAPLHYLQDIIVWALLNINF